MKKLAAKAGLIQIPPAGSAAKAPGAADDNRPKTAPGSMTSVAARTQPFSLPEDVIVSLLPAVAFPWR